MSRTIKAFIGIAAALAFAACGGSGKPAARGGALLSVSTQAISTDVLEVSVRIYDNNTPSTGFDLTVALTRPASGVVDFVGQVDGLPVGVPLTFDATATTPPEAATSSSYTGSAVLTLAPGDNGIVHITLQEDISLLPKFKKGAPIITGISATNLLVTPGNSVGLNVAAIDPDGEALSYAWTVSPAGFGSFASANVANPTFTSTASANGPLTFTVTVDDLNGGLAKASLDVVFSSTPAPANVGVRAIINNAPVVSRIDVAPAFDAVTYPYDSQLIATVSDDGVPGTPLTYAWEVDQSVDPAAPGGGCAGAFSAAVADPVFTVNSAGFAGMCQVIVTVTDGGGASNTGTILFAVDQAPTGNLPRLVSSYQSASSVPAGGYVLVEANFDMGGPLDSQYNLPADLSFDPTFSDLFNPQRVKILGPATCSGPVARTITAVPLDPLTSTVVPGGVAKTFNITFCGP